MKRIRWALVAFAMLVGVLASVDGNSWSRGDVAGDNWHKGTNGQGWHGGGTDGQGWHWIPVLTMTPYPPLNVPTSVAYGSCRVTYMHGTYGGAYAQYQREAGSTCLYPPIVRVSYKKYGWTDTCSGESSCHIGDGWYQAYSPGSSSMTRSQLTLCIGTPSLQDCKSYTFSGT